MYNTGREKRELEITCEHSCVSFTFLLAPKTILHMKWHSLTTPSFSIVPGFCTDLPSAASSSLNIHLWHVSCTHPSPSHSGRRSSHLWSWPSWHGERWWLCTGHASAPGAGAAWKGRNHLSVCKQNTQKTHKQCCLSLLLDHQLFKTKCWKQRPWKKYTD